MLSLTFGYCFMNSKTVSVSKGLKVNVTPMLSSPASMFFRSVIFWTHVSASLISCLAHRYSCWPASVSETSWLLRSNNTVSNSCSNCLICCERVLCVMNSDFEASEKFRSSATFRKYLICLNSMIKPSSIHVSGHAVRHLAEDEDGNRNTKHHSEDVEYARETI